MPGRPRVPTQESPRVVLPSLPTPARPIVTSPLWNPPPRPSGSTFLSPTPVQAPFQATPRRLNFIGTPSPRVGFSPQMPSPIPPLSLPSPLPITPAPGLRHRPHLRSSPLEALSTSVSLTRCPRPKPLGPLLNQLALQASAGPCQLQKYRDLIRHARGTVCVRPIHW
jgi:hypothetical protein